MGAKTSVAESVCDALFCVLRVGVLLAKEKRTHTLQSVWDEMVVLCFESQKPASKMNCKTVLRLRRRIPPKPQVCFKEEANGDTISQVVGKKRAAAKAALPYAECFLVW